MSTATIASAGFTLAGNYPETDPAAGLEDTLRLFAVLKLRPGHTVAALPDHPVMRRWWDHMAPLMEVEPGNRPREWALRQVFYFA